MRLLLIVLICFAILSRSSESSEISGLAKALLYVENGQYELALQQITQHGLTEGVFPLIIRTRVLRSEEAVGGDLNVIPDIEDKVRDRLNYEIARILFERNRPELSREFLLKMKDRNSSSANFVLANIYLLEGKYEMSAEVFEGVKRTEVDELLYRKLRDYIRAESSAVYAKAQLFNSLFFGSLPVRFEDEDVRKDWDLVSQMIGEVDVRFIPYGTVSPFLRYGFFGELYTEVYGYIVQEVKGGLEYMRYMGVLYSLELLTYGNELLGLSHGVFPYVFITRGVRFGVSGRLQAYDEVSERRGYILEFDADLNFARRLGERDFRNAIGLSGGKRFGQAPSFSESFFSVYSANSLSLSGALFMNLEMFGMLSIYPADFEGRRANLLFSISPYFSLNGGYVRWDLIRPVIQMNISDSDRFRWRRVLLGTAVELIL